jgi:ABC-2 type transport system permease protein
MTLQTLYSVGRRINPFLLTGPIFEKELVVSSRRRRNYVLRFAYIALLSFFIVMAWIPTASMYSGAAYRAARMSVMGLAIVSTICFYQFIMTQFAAVIMLSTAISDEIYHKTLGLLMTTPITSFQIVMGKLLSKLLQILLLIGISFPLLVIIRVFGGVPWSYVLSSFCITIAASLFAGALTLYFSIKGRYAYAVILKSIFFLAVLYLFIPIIIFFLMVLIARNTSPFAAMKFIYFLSLFNPFIQMYISTGSLITGGIVGRVGMSLAPWPWHCLALTGFTILLVARSVSIVRKVARSQAAGEFEIGSRRRIKNKKLDAVSKPQDGRSFSDDIIKPVKGSPIVWKELRVPFIKGGRRSTKIAIGFSLAALFLCYLLNHITDALDSEVTHFGYALVFVLLGLITNIVLSATTITGEKESGSWPILLTTPLNNWQIIIGKAIGVFRRCLPIWLFLAGHLILFTLVKYIHPIAIFQMVFVVAGSMVFLGCSGLYFSSLMKRTTSAVVANFGFVAFLWFVMPIFLGLMTQITRSTPKWVNAYLSANPVVQTGVVMTACSGSGNAGSSILNLQYKWPLEGNEDFIRATMIILIVAVCYILFGLLMLYRARVRLRRNIF